MKITECVVEDSRDGFLTVNGIEMPKDEARVMLRKMGVIQPAECPTWYARNMNSPSDEPVRFVAESYQKARAIALSHFNGCVVAVWRGEE